MRLLLLVICTLLHIITIRTTLCHGDPFNDLAAGDGSINDEMLEMDILPVKRGERKENSDIETRRRSALDKNFMRFGRSQSDGLNSGNLMRFGRSDTSGMLSSLHDKQLQDITQSGVNIDEDILNGENSMRHGRAMNLMRFGRTGNLMRFGRSGNNLMRFGRSGNNLMRFGRSSANLMRFGRSGNNLMRFGRSAQNLMRFGRSGNNLMRFGRSGSNLMRFGRSGNLMRFGRSGNLMRFGRNDKGLISFGRPGQEENSDESKESRLPRNGESSHRNGDYDETEEEQQSSQPSSFIRFDRSGSGFMRLGRSNDIPNFKNDNFMRLGRGGETTQDPETVKEDDIPFIEKEDRKLPQQRNVIRYDDSFMRLGRSAELADSDPMTPITIEGASNNMLNDTFYPVGTRRKRSIPLSEVDALEESPKDAPYIVRTTTRVRPFSSLSSGLSSLILGPELLVLPVPPEPRKIIGNANNADFMRLG